MQPKQLKVREGKRICDRCQNAKPPIHECAFEFKHPRAYWAGLYQQESGQRMTLRRRRQFDEQAFDYRRPPTFWMDLCADCWRDCSAPCDLFPLDFDAQVLTPRTAAAKTVVPEKRRLVASGAKAD